MEGTDGSSQRWDVIEGKPGNTRRIGHERATIAQLLGARDARSLPWQALGPQHTVYVREALAARLAPATVNRALAALRRVLKWAWRLGLMTSEAYARAADVPSVTGTTLPRGRALDGGELRALFATIAAGPHPPIRARDAALLATLYGGGLRRAEVVALDVADYRASTSALAVRHGKGRRQRVVYLTNGGRAALAAWLAVRGKDPGALFPPVTSYGRLLPQRRLTPHAVWDWLARLARRAGVATCAPHDLRRSFISDLLDGGADLSTVQQLAGHRAPTTTARYDRRGEHAKLRAAQALHVPYVG
ncbi:MAG TPA: tyrosine-type recombinase/integrase [Candidatus Binatia bacterium]|nr:tyrosine-type recombinase/integrase [Candidatus Binatia bacterium]